MRVPTQRFDPGPKIGFKNDVDDEAGDRWGFTTLFQEDKYKKDIGDFIDISSVMY